ncbi:hypothetical protein ACTFHD_06000 [Campylobacter jejuni]
MDSWEYYQKFIKLCNEEG